MEMNPFNFVFRVLNNDNNEPQQTISNGSLLKERRSNTLGRIIMPFLSKYV